MGQRQQGSSLSVFVPSPHEELPGLAKEVLALRAFPGQFQQGFSASFQGFGLC